MNTELSTSCRRKSNLTLGLAHTRQAHYLLSYTLVLGKVIWKLQILLGPSSCWARWHTPTVQLLRRLRHEELHFEVGLGRIVRPCIREQVVGRGFYSCHLFLTIQRKLTTTQRAEGGTLSTQTRIGPWKHSGFPAACYGTEARGALVIASCP